MKQLKEPKTYKWPRVYLTLERDNYLCCSDLVIIDNETSHRTCASTNETDRTFENVIYDSWCCWDKAHYTFQDRVREMKKWCKENKVKRIFIGELKP